MINPLNKIKKILSTIDNSMEDDAKLAMVKGYWEVGKLTAEYKDSTGKLIAVIADEIEAPKHAVQRYIQFYKTYPDGYPQKYYDRVILWSYICSVLPVHDKVERDFYLKEACKNKWNKHQLCERINNRYYQAVKESSEYNVKSGKKKNIVESKEQQLFTYAAEVIKIVDGDTLDLDIDVGFRLKLEHRVRFRGINCPEISTPEGQKAKAFLEGEFAKCVVEKLESKGEHAARPVVVVKTYKRGLYGRYIVDIYYLPGESNPEVIAKKGKLLNQVLLDQGHASRA
ncbi:MAG: hypothetical protein KKF78_11310 [Candidatus Omnitrophica bacterium]|nr:hypothetical protein [Candidatus Omnitrophota bacterium]MBU1997724.1 hypothetical protein [Candidatus Omnitrophota bacterium]